MPSETRKKSSHLTVRVTDTLKANVKSIMDKDNRTENDAIALMISEYAPIKDKLVTPLLIPRSIYIDGKSITFRTNTLQNTVFSVNGVDIDLWPMDKKSVEDIIANLMLFTQSV